MHTNSLKKKIVVITGGNKGIGKSTLEDFAKSGANIFTCVRTISKDFKKLVKDVQKKYKVKIHIIHMDLAKSSSIKNCFEKIKKMTKKVDILVNNSGMLFNSLFLMTSEKKLKEIFEVNFFSQMLFTQLISKIMIKNKSGSIIFVSSTSGIKGDYGRFAYSSTKAAIINASKTLSKEFASYNIRVNSISPGLTPTDLMKSNTKDDVIKSEIEKISLKRTSNTKEISSVILFLASDMSSYITGQNIIVDGGYL